MSAKSVTVVQHHNPTHTRPDAEQEKNNAEYKYVVETTRNTLGVSVGQSLLPSEVQSLIDNGVNVTVKGTDRG